MPAHGLNLNVGRRWRLLNPRSGRQVVLEAVPGVRYADRDTGEPMKVSGQLPPLSPSGLRLPWTEENLRFCPSCDQLVPTDLNYCPYERTRRLVSLGPVRRR